MERWSWVEVDLPFSSPAAVHEDRCQKAQMSQGGKAPQRAVRAVPPFPE